MSKMEQVGEEQLGNQFPQNLMQDHHFFAREEEQAERYGDDSDIEEDHDSNQGSEEDSRADGEDIDSDGEYDDEDWEQLYMLEHNDPSLDELELRPSSDEYLKRIGDAITDNMYVRHIIFDHIDDAEVASSSLDAIGEGMCRNESISSIHFFDCHIASGAMFRALMSFSETNRLDRLCFLNSTLAPNVSTWLSNCSKSLTDLEMIFQSGNNSSKYALPMRLELPITSYSFPRLSSFQFAGDIKHIGYPVLKTLISTHMPNLEILELKDSEMNDKGMEVVTSALAKNRVLEKLKIEGNCSRNGGITSKGWKLLSAFLQRPDTKLRDLDVSGCSLGNDDIMELSSGITKTKTLRSLSLCKNPSITAVGWARFGRALSESRLEKLSIGDNGLDYDKMSALSSTLFKMEHLKELCLSSNPTISGGGIQMLSSLLANPLSKIEFVDLCLCSITDDDIMIMSGALKSNSNLECLELSNNQKISDASSSRLEQEVLCDTTSIGNTYFSNHTLREFCWFDPDLLENDNLRSMLALNRIKDKKCVAAKKVFLCHFSGNFDLRPFEKMKTSTLVDVLGWVGTPLENDLVDEDTRLKAMYHLVKSSPSLFGV